MSSPRNKFNIFLVCAALVVVTFAAYERLRHNEFVDLDDYGYVVENPNVNNGITLESVFWAFTTSHKANWHPLTWLSHMLDCEFFDLNPAWHHLTNLFFHLINTFLLFLVLRAMTGAVWRSAFVAAAFGLHPLHVESVAWVSERKDVLSGLFWMLTLLAYAHYAKRPSIKRYLVVLLLFSLGLMAKPMLVTLPFLMLVLDYWPLNRFRRQAQWSNTCCETGGLIPQKPDTLSFWQLVKEKSPMFVIVAASGMVTFFAQRSKEAVMLMEYMPFDFRIANALTSYIKYVHKMVYPSQLAVFYPLKTVLSIWQPILSLLILICILLLVIRRARRQPYLPVGWLWYVGTLVPVIGLVQVGEQAFADRYTYLPSIGLFIMAGWLTADMVGKWRYRTVILGLTSAAIMVTLFICTRIQVGYWQNNLTLFGRAAKVTENNYRMNNNYGLALFNNGRIEEAISQFRQSLRINPEHCKAQNNLGMALLSLGQIDEAIFHFQEAIRLEPEYINAISNLAIAFGRQGKFDKAIENYRRILDLRPNDYIAYFNIGLAMAEKGQYDDAIEYFQNALRLNPDWAMLHYELAAVYYRQNKFDLVVKHCRDALRLKPDFLEVRINLARALVRSGKVQPAVDEYREVLKLAPERIEVLDHLAWILATSVNIQIGEPEEAVKFAKKACELSGYNQPKLMDTLAAAYAAAGKFTEAVETGQKALKLAQRSGEKKLTNEIRKRLRLYQIGKPYRHKDVN